MKHFEMQESKTPLESSDERAELREPQSEEEAMGLIDKTTKFIAQKLYSALSKYRLGAAERKLKGQPPMEKIDEFRTLRWKATEPIHNVFVEPRHLEQPDIYGVKSPESIWKKYLKRAGKKRESIREDTIKSYLYLRKARKIATSPEGRIKLKELFRRQVEMMRLMHSSDYSKHLDTLKKDIEADIASLKERLAKISPTVTPDMERWATERNLPSGALGILAEIEADIEKKKLQKRVEKSEILLKNLNRFAEKLAQNTGAKPVGAAPRLP